MTSASSRFSLLLAPTALAVATLNLACSSSSMASSGSDALRTDAPALEPDATGDSANLACSNAGPLAGATYDITKSKFAFGSAPAAVNAGSLVRWTGSEGVVALFSDGSEMTRKRHVEQHESPERPTQAGAGAVSLGRPLTFGGRAAYGQARQDVRCDLALLAR
jgi:hypothetical protein